MAYDFSIQDVNLEYFLIIAACIIIIAIFFAIRGICRIRNKRELESKYGINIPKGFKVKHCNLNASPDLTNRSLEEVTPFKRVRSTRQGGDEFLQSIRNESMMPLPKRHH